MGLRRSFKPTNLVKNGDFSKGTTRWLSSNNGIPIVSNNIYAFTATAQYGQLLQELTPTAAGDIYYYFAQVKANSNKVRACLTTSPAQVTISHSGSGNFERLTGIYTLPSSPVYLRIRVEDTNASGWAEVQTKELLTINLTGLLHASMLTLSDADLKAWCDLNIPVWFDGTLGGGVINGTGGLK